MNKIKIYYTKLLLSSQYKIKLHPIVDAIASTNWSKLVKLSFMMSDRKADIKQTIPVAVNSANGSKINDIFTKITCVIPLKVMQNNVKNNLNLKTSISLKNIKSMMKQQTENNEIKIEIAMVQFH